MANPERLVYIDGRLVPESEATISIFDVGRLYGVTPGESVWAREIPQRFDTPGKPGR